MTEQELQQTLSETRGFLQRQSLLKQLWQVRRQPDELAEKVNLSADPRVLSSRATLESRQAEPLIA